MNTTPKPFWNPWLAGVALGVTLLATFVLTGHGLGATGFTTRLSAWAQTTLPGPVVSTQWLADNLNNVQVLEVRGDDKSFTAKPEIVTTKDGKKQLEEFGGHIPGSRLLPSKRMRVERTIGDLKVKYLLPDAPAFEKIVRDAGIDGDKPIVIVPTGQSLAELNDAARAYWRFKVWGEDNVALLDGGMVAWLLEGRPFSTEAPAPKVGQWSAKADRRARYLAESDDVAAAAGKGVQVVDARDAALYHGLVKRDYVYAYGHIDGAKWLAPETTHLVSGGAVKLLKPEQYRQLFKVQGIDPAQPLITYCNSGHLSSLPWFVASELLGNTQTRLYDGSLHQWTLEKRPLVSALAQ